MAYSKVLWLLYVMATVVIMVTADISVQNGMLYKNYIIS